MFKSRVSENDLKGVVFFRIPNGDFITKITNYFEIVKKLVSLVRSNDFITYVTGYYLNFIEEEGVLTVRLSYFSLENKETETIEVIEKFVDKTDGLNLLKKPKSPLTGRTSDEYGGDEPRFRNYLALFSLIGLDIILNNALFSKKFMDQYSQNLHQGKSPKLLLEPIFNLYSPTYDQLSPIDKEQLWKDFELRGYAHMFENMMVIPV